MSGEHGSARLRVEDWEIELAKRIAGKFRATDEDLAAHLLMRVTELKVRRRGGIKNWQAFLAQSLYNAAKNFIRHEDVLRRRISSYEVADAGDERRLHSLEETFAASEELLDLRLDLAEVRRNLTPELRRLWQLLVDHDGNTSSVARELGRPRKTVEYWIQKLKNILSSHGIR